jgi:hypothetical protein
MQRNDNPSTDANPNAAAEAGQDAGAGASSSPGPVGTDRSFAGSKPGRDEVDERSLTDDQRRARELGRAAMRTLIGGSDEEGAA